MARKKKPELIKEAQSLGLQVSTDDHYDDILAAVREASEESSALVPDDEDPQEDTQILPEDVEAEFDPQEVEEPPPGCTRCGRPADVTDTAGGRASPVHYCMRHAPARLQ